HALATTGTASAASGTHFPTSVRRWRLSVFPGLARPSKLPISGRAEGLEGVMRAALVMIGLVLGAMVCAGVTAALAGDLTYVKGNDTGGIISWSCEAEAAARAIAADHCARWDKFARITSVHRRYGDYIAFQCLWNPHQARYAIPAVGTRSICPSRIIVKTRY